MDSNSDSDDSTGGSRVEWEVVSMTGGSSDPDYGGGGSGDTNGNGHDGEVHEQDVPLHLHHFSVSQTSTAECEQQPIESGISGTDSGAQTRVVRDWVEPSTSGYNKDDSEPATKDDFDSVNKQLDLELDSGMFATLVSSVLESGGATSPIKRNLGEYSGGTLAEVESLASLQRELLSEAGFSSLVPSDIHGNVLRPEDQDEAAPGDEEEGDDDDGDGGVGGRLRSWRRKLLLWRDYIQRASTLWSLTIAAALMGLVIIGQRWHHERWQNQQLRLQLCCKDEKISQLLFQIARLKEAVSGRRRVPVIKASSM